MGTKHEFDFDFTKLKKVPIDQVKANGWNPKDKDTKEYKQVLRSIAQNGLRDPVAVREIDKDSYEVIDGEQRLTAAKELGYSEIYVYNEGKMSDKDAKALTIWYQVQVPFNEVDLSHLVVELNDMGMELPYSEAQIADFKNMAAFDFDNFDNGGDTPDDTEFRSLSLKLGSEAFEIVMKAINHVKEENDCSEARAIELICADYLSGVGE